MSRCHTSEKDILDFIRKRGKITYARLESAFGKKLRDRVARLVKKGKLKTERSGYGREFLYSVNE